ncbi:hypothetical protein GYMLUDRAFT_240519 [Collybiopsis luxurians FD-317 M1]|nr:hypothetical protein GYMLUDRAFT_240519 [Collybiopsis luxurians FD-317 M1]
MAHAQAPATYPYEVPSLESVHPPLQNIPGFPSIAQAATRNMPLCDHVAKLTIAQLEHLNERGPPFGSPTMVDSAQERHTVLSDNHGGAIHGAGDVNATLAQIQQTLRDLKQNMNTRFDEVNTRFDGVNTQFDAVSGNLNRLQHENANARFRVMNAREDIGAPQVGDEAEYVPSQILCMNHLDILNLILFYNETF